MGTPTVSHKQVSYLRTWNAISRSEGKVESAGASDGEGTGVLKQWGVAKAVFEGEQETARKARGLVA